MAQGGAGGASTDLVAIADFAFDPETVTVDAGTKLTWTNDDEAPHTATADDGSFDTGTLKLDDTGAVAHRSTRHLYVLLPVSPVHEGNGGGPVGRFSAEVRRR